MKNQQIQLINVLKEARTAKTSSSLANALNISPRSVKTYINEINEMLPGTISSSRSGYVIDAEKADALLNDTKTLIPQTSDERMSYAVNRIIKQGVVNAYDLCDEMFISYSTLKSDLAKARKSLEQYQLQLINQNDMLMINGLEKNKRKYLSSLLYSESLNNFVNYEKMAENFEGIDVAFIKDTILKKFEEHHYFINDYSLENLILHSTITIDRIRNGYITTATGGNPVFLRSHEYDLAASIISELEQHFNIHFNDIEVTEFTMLILSRASNHDYETITMDNVRQYVGEDIYLLAEQLIKEFSSFFYIDLSQPEFFIRFCLHIKNLLIRADNDYFSRNPLTNSIKQNCPLIYDCAVNSARTIKDKTSINLNDDEIAYIAFHLGGALELQATLTNKLTAYIFCPGYYNMNIRMFDAIVSRFSEVLVIAGILTQEEELSKVNGDMIISTMRIQDKTSIPTVIVSPFMSEQDLRNIYNLSETIREKKKRSTFRNHLTLLIREELFTVNHEKLSKEEAIHKMAERFKELGYCGDEFEGEVLERDAISSTAFDQFAIPHAMKMHEKKTGINIMICDEPVDWDGREVKLIMMLCFNRDERYLFNELFEPISMILIDPDNLNKVIKARTAEEFIDLLAQLRT